MLQADFINWIVVKFPEALISLLSLNIFYVIPFITNHIYGRRLDANQILKSFTWFCIIDKLIKILSSFIFISASRIRYEITSGNIGGAFAVKNMTGAIYVAGALDYETRKRVSWFHF